MAAAERVKKYANPLRFNSDSGTLGQMPEWRYRGREVTTEDIGFIRTLVAENPGASRRALSATLCEAWQWKQANGTLRDMVCRGCVNKMVRSHGRKG